MAQISVMLAVAAPLLHARVRGIIAHDPGTVLVYEALNGLDAVEQVRATPPHIVLCDRQMLGDPDFAALRKNGPESPLVVLVTVNSEGLPAQAPIALAGTVPFDTRPGDLASRLRAILHIDAARPEELPLGASRVFTPSPEVARLSARFTISEPLPALAGAAARRPVAGRQPVPTKTAQLKKTSFLKSVLEDPDPASQQSRASFLS